MHLLYLHGLDSNPTATKAVLTQTYANQAGIVVTCPDLNLPPQASLDKILSLIQKDTVIIGSSLGGYFATLASDLTGTPAILLNPSIRPDLSFKRFLANQNFENLQDDMVIYTTLDGWQIVYGDLAWFETHRLTAKHGDRLKVLLKAGDELLDAQASADFYGKAGAVVDLQAGGDHRISDYADHLPKVLAWADELCTAHTDFGKNAV